MPIFVVGFPKCGTSSINCALNRAGISSAHWSIKFKNQIHWVGLLIDRAKKEKKPLLSYLSQYSAITQMDVCFEKNCYWPQLLDVPTLDSQYHNSKFVFNDRNVDNWIRSIDNWGDLRNRLINSEIPGLPMGKGSSDKDLIDWYYWHKNNLTTYFKNKDNFIIFNIERDKGEKLGEFLGVNNFVMPHLKKGSRRP